MVDPVWLIPAFPLLGALLMLFAGRRLPKTAVSVICIGAVLLSFLVSAIAVLSNHGVSREITLYRWLPLLQADVAFLLDPLSSIMILIVTGIGALIHFYSAGYMAREEGYYRYFGFLNLFVFFMLLLVLANNYALLFVGWEGVGLCSYLLIGFYFRKSSAIQAGKKAFLVNRIGDWGFLLGILAVWTLAGTLNFTALPARLQSFQPETTFGPLSLTTLLLFLGATGKSAQFPLYVWLPDAMEGPTPVSALIHAATMVTAGVYMVARSSVLFQFAPPTLDIIAPVGAFTAILAASIALVQTDIKRVLAYSTISQLGFMFMALGVGAYWVAIFHLYTHAFFKALLFLGAGSVIHGMAGEQDMRRMGGLRRSMPVTFWTMCIAALAISGIPFLSGFYSKEEILTHAFLRARQVYAVGIVTAGMTAYYMWRLMRMTFLGEARDAAAHPHESPWTMTVPLIVLAIGSIAAGWPAHAFERYLAPLFPAAEAVPLSPATAWILAGAAVAVAAAGIAVAAAGVQVRGPVHNILLNKWYVDEAYNAVFVQGIATRVALWLDAFDRNVIDGAVNRAVWMTRLNSRVAIFWDTWIIDGLVRLSSLSVQAASYPARLMQTGSLQTYALFFVFGILVIFGIYVTRS